MTASAGPVLKRLHGEFGEDLSFLTLYVREAHPGERYPQVSSFDEKIAHARAYQERDHIPWPVAVDDVSGNFHRLLDPKPNAGYIIDLHGNVAFRSLWSNDEGALRKGLEGIVRRPDRPVGEAQTRLVPMLTGAGRMHDILSRSGEVAKRDVLREAPPMYGMARIAALFGPLPPLGRGVAAAAVMMLGAVIAVAGFRSILGDRKS